jgi:hypothetical protein
MIKAQYAILAEFQRGQDLIGIFDRITTASLPGQQRNLAFVVLLVTDSAQDVGPKDIRIKCLLPTGVTMFEQAMRVELNASDNGTWLAAARIAFEVQGLPIPMAGKYVLRLEMNDELLASHPFTVTLAPTPAQP